MSHFVFILEDAKLGCRGFHDDRVQIPHLSVTVIYIAFNRTSLTHSSRPILEEVLFKSVNNSFLFSLHLHANINRISYKDLGAQININDIREPKLSDYVYVIARTQQSLYLSIYLNK